MFSTSRAHIAFLVLGIAGTLLLFLSSASHATDAASWHPESPGAIFDNFGRENGPVPYRGQTLLAEATGILRGGSLRMGQWGAPPSILRIELRSTDGAGLPSTEVLDFLDVPLDSIPRGVPDAVQFQFPGSVRLQSGQTYALVAYPVPFVLFGDPFYLNGEQGALADYAGGNAVTSTNGIQWQAYPETDYGFRITLGSEVSAERRSWSAIKLLY